MNVAHSTREIRSNRLLTKGISELSEPGLMHDVAFRILHFAFAAYFAPHHNYVSSINRAARPKNVGRSV